VRQTDYIFLIVARLIPKFKLNLLPLFGPENSFIV